MTNYGRFWISTITKLPNLLDSSNEYPKHSFALPKFLEFFSIIDDGSFIMWSMSNKARIGAWDNGNFCAWEGFFYIGTKSWFLMKPRLQLTRPHIPYAAKLVEYDGPSWLLLTDSNEDYLNKAMYASF